MATTKGTYVRKADGKWWTGKRSLVVSSVVPLTRSGITLSRKLSGMNCYWLGLNDNGGVSTGSLPSHATITSAFDGMQAMGVNLVRAHTVGMSAGTSLSYLTGFTGTTPNYVEANMDSADWAVYQAGLHGIVLQCPLTDNWNYYHGGLWNFVHWAYQQNSSGITDVNEGFTGGTGKDDPNQRIFFANTTAGLRVRALFKAYITQWLNHVNPYTGLAYKDDPTIAIVETGNEIYYAAQLGTNEWTQDIASYVKGIAPNKLVADGSGSSGTAVSAMPGLTAAAVDIVTPHYYPVSADWSSPVAFGAANSHFTGTNTARQQFAADFAAGHAAGRVVIMGEYPWTRSDVAAWWADIEASGIQGDMAWAFIAGTEVHGGAFGSDDYPVHYPYLSGNEATYAPALSTHIKAMVAGVVTTPASATLATDSFSGTNNNPWNSSLWTITAGQNSAGAAATIQNNRGNVYLGTLGGYGGRLAAKFGGGPYTNIDFTQIIQMPNSTSDYFIEIATRADVLLTGNNGYYANMYMYGQLNVNRVINGVSTNLANNLSMPSFGVGVDCKIRVYQVGTAYKLKFWVASATEPTAWNFEVTDAGIASGYVGTIFKSGDTAGGNIIVDEVVLTDGAAGPGGGATGGSGTGGGTVTPPATGTGVWYSGQSDTASTADGSFATWRGRSVEIGGQWASTANPSDNVAAADWAFGTGSAFACSRARPGQLRRPVRTTRGGRRRSSR
jgi:mannan endo-1,4-beta-mannosidase